MITKKETLTGKEETRCQAKDRLERNLESLESYCKPGVIPEKDIERDGWVAGLLSAVSGSSKLVSWPMRGLLKEIEHDVLVLAFLERKTLFLSVWKAFEQVDKRMKKLQLKVRLNDVIDRARAMLSGESKLSKDLREAMAGKAQAQCSLRDMVLDTQKLVELLGDDRRRTIQRCMAHQLVCWLIEIDHPSAKDFNNIVEFLPTVEERKAMLRRGKDSDRHRRWREAKKNSSK